MNQLTIPYINKDLEDLNLHIIIIFILDINIFE